MSLHLLPLELVSLIVDEFKDDRQFLKLISLISRPFLNACRTHLFTILRLDSPNPLFDYKCAAWDSFLRRSSALLPYIRVLDLGPSVFRLASRDASSFSNHWTDVVDRGSPSIDDERVESIIAGAVNAQVVTLRFEYQSWGNFSPSFQRVVLDLLKRVSSLTIEDVVDFPLEALRHCRRLRNLSLVSVTALQDPDAPGELGQGLKGSDQQGHLDSLMTVGSDQCVHTLLQALSSPESSLNISHLRRLSVNATGTDGRIALNKIPISSPFITSLELRVNNTPEYELCDLGSFPNLRSLCISVSYSLNRRPIRPLARFLSRSGKPSNLEELKVFFRQDVTDSEIVEVESSSQALTRICISRDWRELEQKLAAQTRFPRLKRMSLVFRPKDITIFLNEYLTMSLHLCLVQAMPALYALTNPTIEVYDDRFEQYIQI